MKIGLDNGFILLTVIFACLKLAGVIDWSWWIVLLPMLVPFGLALAAILVIFAIVALREMFRGR